MNIHKSAILSYNNEAFTEITNTKAIIDAIITCCQDKEFKGQYYNLSKSLKYMLSDERNKYMSLLTIASDKLANLIHINCCIENEISVLQKNSYNSGR